MSETSGSPPLESVTASERENSPASKSPLYQSLLAAIEHPNCVKPAWIDTVTNSKNNPRGLPKPYNDGSLHWVNNSNDLLCMAFPAVLDLDGKYGRTGPYFSLSGTQGKNVSQALPCSIPPADVP
jgi:hypothetical protein